MEFKKDVMWLEEAEREQAFEHVYFSRFKRPANVERNMIFEKLKKILSSESKARRSKKMAAEMEALLKKIYDSECDEDDLGYTSFRRYAFCHIIARTVIHQTLSTGLTDIDGEDLFKLKRGPGSMRTPEKKAFATITATVNAREIDKYLPTLNKEIRLQIQELPRRSRVQVAANERLENNSEKEDLEDEEPENDEEEHEEEDEGAGAEEAEVEEAVDEDGEEGPGEVDELVEVLTSVGEVAADEVAGSSGATAATVTGAVGTGLLVARMAFVSNPAGAALVGITYAAPKLTTLGFSMYGAHNSTIGVKDPRYNSCYVTMFDGLPLINVSTYTMESNPKSIFKAYYHHSEYENKEFPISAKQPQKNPFRLYFYDDDGWGYFSPYGTEMAAFEKVHRNDFLTLAKNDGTWHVMFAKGEYHGKESGTVTVQEVTINTPGRTLEGREAIASGYLSLTAFDEQE